MKKQRQIKTKKSFKKKQNVLIFGTFDLLHKGHLDFFRQAKKYGRVTAVIARDRTVLQVKGKKPVHNEKTRLKNVKKYIDKAVLGSAGNKYDIIKKIRPDIICLGYDQRSFTKNLRQEICKRKLRVKITRLKPHKLHIYKSKFLREK